MLAGALGSCLRLLLYLGEHSYVDMFGCGLFDVMLRVNGRTASTTRIVSSSVHVNGSLDWSLLQSTARAEIAADWLALSVCVPVHVSFIVCGTLQPTTSVVATSYRLLLGFSDLLSLIYPADSVNGSLVAVAPSARVCLGRWLPKCPSVGRQQRQRVPPTDDWPLARAAAFTVYIYIFFFSLNVPDG